MDTALKIVRPYGQAGLIEKDIQKGGNPKTIMKLIRETPILSNHLINIETDNLNKNIVLCRLAGHKPTFEKFNQLCLSPNTQPIELVRELIVEWESFKKLISFCQGKIEELIVMPVLHCSGSDGHIITLVLSWQHSFWHSRFVSGSRKARPCQSKTH